MLKIILMFFVGWTLSACDSEDEQGKSPSQETQLSASDLNMLINSTCLDPNLYDDCLGKLLQFSNVSKVDEEEFSSHTADQVRLGQLLFFDKILSGSNDVACATCHHPSSHTADSFSLSGGVGSSGLREQRQIQNENQLVPRHAPSIFNRGHREFTKMFWDGRVEVEEGGTKISSPAKEALPEGLESVLAAQALFPPTSHVEMRGQPGANAVANLEDLNEIWSSLTERVKSNAQYRALFAKAYPQVSTEALTFAHIGNAIAAFESTEFRSIHSPFDSYLEGDDMALSNSQKRGAILFYGKAKCSSCHAGSFQTDHKFHNIASPQFGPGKGDGPDGRLDYGRQKVTKNDADKNRFKTAPLRNVELTAPYGHTGAFHSLESIIRHKLNSHQANEERSQLLLTLPGWEMNFASEPAPNYVLRMEAANGNNLPKVSLADSEIYDLVDFMTALTDTKSRDMMHLIPASVPSGYSIP
jgi:cytochrome c peroxidase